MHLSVPICEKIITVDSNVNADTMEYDSTEAWTICSHIIKELRRTINLVNDVSGLNHVCDS